MEYLMTLKGKRVILNVQHSKIGNAYPRIFIEVNEERYVNIDCTIGAAFRMEKEDFKDWLEDAKEVPEAEHQKTCEEWNINYEALLENIQILDDNINKAGK